MNFYIDKKTKEICLFDETLKITGLKAWLLPQNGEKFYLKIKEFSDKKIIFVDENEKSQFTLTVIRKYGCYALLADVKYVADDNASLDMKTACGIDFDNIDGLKGLNANGIGEWAYWCKIYIPDNLSQIPKDTQSVLASLDNEKYAFLLTTCDTEAKSFISGNESGGFTLSVYTGIPMSSFSLCALILGYDEDPYILPKKTVACGMQIMNKPGKMRKERKYPEIFEYLGWCSWDALGIKVNEKELLVKCEEFKQKQIPINWVIIDDMWADVPGLYNPEYHNNEEMTKVMYASKLNSFEGDPQRFPKGLKHCIQEIQKFGIKVGMWHPFTGYWFGIEPNGPIAKEFPNDLITTADGRLVFKLSYSSLFKFFNAFHSFLKDCGTEFVKIDFQSGLPWIYVGKENIGIAATNLHNALEDSVDANFDGNLINCMGMGNDSFWNRPRSNINRISGDFLPENRAWFNQHIVQCSYNSLIQGCVYTGDWDMWWSDDGQAVKNAVLRAMSGGPIYVSDKIGRSIKEVIMPLVYRDGKIIRLEDPAIPTKDCLVDDCRKNGKIFKIFNRVNQAGILAAFNIDAEEKEVSGTVSALDVYGLENKKYVLYNYFSKEFEILDNTSAVATLKNYDDFRLYFILPYNEVSKITPIGILDKYMAPATFQIVDENKYIVYEGGEFGVYSESENIVIECADIVIRPKKVAENVYSFDLPKEQNNLFVEVKVL